MQLTGTSDAVKVNTSASGTIHVYASWVDLSAGVITPGRTNTAAISGTGDTTVVAAPASSTQRRVKHLSIRNAHASTTNTIRVIHTDGTNALDVFSATLLAGEQLTYTDGIGWTYIDVTGAVHSPSALAATQAQMEAATSNIVFATPLNLNWHPGVAKFWVIFTGNSTTITASWNMTSITDGSTEATVTIATDFSSSAWCCLALGVGTTSSAVANSRLATARSLAAGTVIVFAIDGQATPVIQDPTSWCVAGFGDQ